jgi:hypothetical protein
MSKPAPFERMQQDSLACPVKANGFPAAGSVHPSGARLLNLSRKMSFRSVLSCIAVGLNRQLPGAKSELSYESLV